jgi:prepilin-type processing-associated H-X9-DG protein
MDHVPGVSSSAPRRTSRGYPNYSEHFLRETYSSYYRNHYFFGFNWEDEAQSPSCGYTGPRSIASVSLPSSTIMFTDGWTLIDFLQNPSENITLMNRSRLGDYYCTNCGPMFFTGTRHRGRSNYLFADGYVKALTIRQTLTPEVMWDKITNWCPGCGGCEYGQDWTSKDIQTALKLLDQLHYP